MQRVDISTRSRHGIIIVLAGVLFGIALWLRWQYVTKVGLHVDEFTMLWVGQIIQDRGAALLPSGVFYTRAILPFYVNAAFLALGGISALMGRLPSLLFGVASILTVFYIGRREWNTAVGLLAALGLALLPEAIEASGRARFYSQASFFVLLTAWTAFVALQSGYGERVEDKSTRSMYLLFALCFVVAIFSQALAALIYPAIFLATLVWHGRQVTKQPGALLAHAICVGAIVLRLAVEQAGPLNHFAGVEAAKPYLTTSLDVYGAWLEYDELLIDSNRLAWTLAGILAVLAAFVDLWKAKWRFRNMTRFHQATLFFALPFLSVLLPLVTIAGDIWRADRYLLIVQPFWLLTGAAGAVWLVDRLLTREALRWVAAGSMVILVMMTMWSDARGKLDDQALQYEQAFSYVATHRQPGDIVMSPLPPICPVVLGEPCDYYARQDGYETYVTRRNGQLIDIWTGAPLLRTPDHMQRVIQEAPRVWLVTDGERLTTRYDLDLIRTIVEQFDIAYEAETVRVLVAEKWKEPPDYVVKRMIDPPQALGPLRLTRWERTQPAPGKEMHVMLIWEDNGDIRQQINTSVHVVPSNGLRLTQTDGPPARGMRYTFEDRGEPVPDPKTLSLPADLAPGWYRLEIIAYDVRTHTPLADPLPLDWFRIGAKPAVPEREQHVRWEHGITLRGHDVLPASLSPGEVLSPRLVWTTTSPIPHDYSVFMHLVGPADNIVSQSDRAPEDGFYPTSRWDTGTVVEETYMLSVPQTLSPGTYRLIVGWYRPDTGARLSREAGSDTLEVAQWVVE